MCVCVCSGDSNYRIHFECSIDRKTKIISIWNFQCTIKWKIPLWHSHTHKYNRIIFGEPIHKQVNKIIIIICTQLNCYCIVCYHEFLLFYLYMHGIYITRHKLYIYIDFTTNQWYGLKHTHTYIRPLDQLCHQHAHKINTTQTMIMNRHFPVHIKNRFRVNKSVNIRFM